MDGILDQFWNTHSTHSLSKINHCFYHSIRKEVPTATLTTIPSGILHSQPSLSCTRHRKGYIVSRGAVFVSPTQGMSRVLTIREEYDHVPWDTLRKIKRMNYVSNVRMEWQHLAQVPTLHLSARKVCVFPDRRKIVDPMQSLMVQCMTDKNVSSQSRRIASLTILWNHRKQMDKETIHRGSITHLEKGWI